jgi:hypothetical protein
MVPKVRNLGDAALGDAEQRLVGVMPGVPAGIVRRRGQQAVGAALAPVRLHLQLRAMAGRAARRVDPASQREHPGVARPQRVGAVPRRELVEDEPRRPKGRSRVDPCKIVRRRMLDTPRSVFIAALAPPRAGRVLVPKLAGAAAASAGTPPG